jgi:hypothetical protein
MQVCGERNQCTVELSSTNCNVIGEMIINGISPHSIYLSFFKYRTHPSEKSPKPGPHFCDNLSWPIQYMAYIFWRDGPAAFQAKLSPKFNLKQEFIWRLVMLVIPGCSTSWNEFKIIRFCSYLLENQNTIGCHELFLNR